MSDTARTPAELLAIFADGQAEGSITPQDMRDLIVSVQGSYGGLEINVADETQILTAGTFVKAAGTTNLIVPSNNFSMTENNRLSYTGTATRNFLVVAGISFTAEADSKTICFSSAINGVVKTPRVCATIGEGDYTSAVAGVRIVTLSENDYLELFVTNETSTDNITVTQMGYFVVSFFG